MKNICRIFVPGGILSPGDLRRIVMTAYHFDCENIHFSSRQEILFDVKKNYQRDIDTRLKSTQYRYEFETDKCQNIVSSFAASGIHPSVDWFGEGMYHEIISSFDYQPTLRINIADPIQTLVPLFTGDINYVASKHYNYWYLYIRLKESAQPFLWPVLVDGMTIAELSKKIEDVILANPAITFKKLQDKIYEHRNWNFRIHDEDFKLPPYRFPNIEGFHKQEEGKFWLGIYRGDNKFSIKFLESICILCSQTNNNRLSITPWRSLLIKNIDEKDLGLWEALLGKYSINTGHSMLELNWEYPELDKEAIGIKKYIFNAFNDMGIRTDGLIFGLKTTDADILASSIHIERKAPFRLFNFSFFRHFEVSYKKDFNPNSFELVPYAVNIKKVDLPGMLAYLTEMYYKKLLHTMEFQKTKPEQEGLLFKGQQPQEDRWIHQCKECQTVYDPELGDPRSDLMGDIPFEQLPDSFTCSLCDGPKSSYIPVNSKKLAMA